MLPRATSAGGMLVRAGRVIGVQKSDDGIAPRGLHRWVELGDGRWWRRDPYDPLLSLRYDLRVSLRSFQWLLYPRKI